MKLCIVRFICRLVAQQIPVRAGIEKRLIRLARFFADRERDGAVGILRADAPDKPWFTLQVELKTVKELQNHGLRNCAPTKEVQKFVERWLEHIRRMKIAGKKQKTEAAA